MKFTINSKTLQSRLSAAFKAVHLRSPIAILSNYLITVSGDTVTIRSSDSEITMSVSANTSGTIEEGSVCVDAKFLTSLIKNTADVPVTISSDGRKVAVSTPSGKYTTAAIDPSSYPYNEKQGDASVCFTIASEVFTKGLQSVSFACATDSFRPLMTGVCVDCSADNGLRMYATDTRKLAKFCKHAQSALPDCRFVIPARIVPLLTAAEGDLTVSISANSVDFKTDSFWLRSQLILGVFPDCERVFPKECTTSADVCKSTLSGAIRRANVCSDQGTSIIKLAFADSSVEVSASDVQYERHSTESVPCSLSGDPITIAFAYDYLLETLGVLSGEDVTIRLTDPARPAVMKNAADAENEFTVLLMPMSING